MRYEWLDSYLQGRLGAEKSYKAEWQMFRYLVGGKQFAGIGGDKEGRPIITLKLEPANGEWMRGQYADVVPGYYSNKMHWNSVYLEGNVPDEALREMVDESHRLVLASLTKKARQEILDANLD